MTAIWIGAPKHSACLSFQAYLHCIALARTMQTFHLAEEIGKEHEADVCTDEDNELEQPQFGPKMLWNGVIVVGKPGGHQGK